MEGLLVNNVDAVFVQVIIQGFRSYRDQTVVDPFSPKHNVIGECLSVCSSLLQHLCVLKSSDV